MKVKSTCKLQDCMDYDIYDGDLADVYESTLTSILDMDEDEEVQADFENHLKALNEDEGATSSDMNLASVQVE